MKKLKGLWNTCIGIKYSHIDFLQMILFHPRKLFCFSCRSLTNVRGLQTLAYWVFDSALSHGASLGDFLLAPVCPTEKIALREDLLYLTSASETECYIYATHIVYTSLTRFFRSLPLTWLRHAIDSSMNFLKIQQTPCDYCSL